jgi:hypothetical protein
MPSLPTSRSKARPWWLDLLLILILPKKSKPWVLYALVVMAVLYLLWKIAPVQVAHLLVLLSPFHVGTPHISGMVVNALTGRPVPAMDVCLLVTKVDTWFNTSIKVMHSMTTRTDASGTFFFDRWDDFLDLFDKWDGYGIAVTDPAARWNAVCGNDTYLLGRGVLGFPDILKREVETARQHAHSSENERLPYFPVAAVKDPQDPHPSIFENGLLSWLPHAAVVQKIGDNVHLKLAVIPLLRHEDECRSAEDPNVAELCREMNVSDAADALRKAFDQFARR